MTQDAMVAHDQELPSRAATGTRGAETQHLAPLDGLRGLAILAVILFHETGSARSSSLIARGLFAVIHSGWAGVDLFFVLSGFLITGILVDHKGMPGYYRNFYARRILRIFPLYYGVLLVVFGVLPHVPAFPQAGLEEASRHQLWLWTYTSNFWSAFTGLYMNFPGVFLSHFWSLAIEEQFYLIWPTIVLLLARRTLIRLCIGVAVFSLVARLAAARAGMAEWPMTAATPLHLDALALGALVALVARDPIGHGRMDAPARWCALGAGCALCVVLAATGDFRSSALEAGVALSLLALFFAAVLAWVVARPRSRLSHLLSSAGLRLVGRYSYGLYVFSSLLQPYTEEVFSTKRIAGLVHSVAVAGLLHLVSTVAVGLLVAMISFHVFEKRFLALKRFFDYAPGGDRGALAGSGPSR